MRPTVFKIDSYNESVIRGNPVQEYLNRNKPPILKEKTPEKPYIHRYMQKNKFVKWMNNYIESLDWKRITRDIYEQTSFFDDINTCRVHLYKVVISQHKSDYQNIINVLNTKNHSIKVNTLKIILKNDT